MTNKPTKTRKNVNDEADQGTQQTKEAKIRESLISQTKSMQNRLKVKKQMTNTARKMKTKEQCKKRSEK
jgi:hypothetical protein